MVNRIVSAAVRRLAWATMKCMPIPWPACVLEDLDNEMITEAPIPGGRITIDEFVARFRPPIPTYIKLDVDGLELPIVAGAKEILCHPHLRGLMVELSVTRKSERDEAIELLKSAGLHLVSQGKEQGMGTERGANRLFQRHPAI